jgi:pyruvate formate lyase activating enzyme
VSDITGRIFDIQRFSIHDGPGIRTTVFLKGCPLRCLWCHNPEGVAPEPELSFLPDKCIGCRYCLSACSRQAHRAGEDGRHLLDRTRCVVCGQCAKSCYSGALEVVGRDVTVEETLEEVLKDRTFYETSGGGMTLSGGEPLLQIDFTEALLERACDEGLDTAVETCGHAAWDRFARLLDNVDLFLYDIKETDPARHMEYAGVGNELILENLRRLHDAGAAVLVRLPIVPGLNDRPDHFEKVAELARGLPHLKGVEVMPYHRLGTSKLARFGLSPRMQVDVEAPTRETVEAWIAALRGLGARVVNS